MFHSTYQIFSTLSSQKKKKYYCFINVVLIQYFSLQRSKIQIWLYEQSNTRIEGHIIGFDEYMNLVLDEAEEVHIKNKNRKPIGESI